MQIPLWKEIPITDPTPGGIRFGSVTGRLNPRAKACSSRDGPPLLLASASPSKVAVLELLGLRFTVSPANIDEKGVSAPTPEALVVTLARLKAANRSVSHPNHLVLGADTLVVDAEGPIGKPDDAEHAKAILRRLSGATHRVVSGIVLADPESGLSADRLAISLVSFRQLSPETIDRYVSSGEPFGKAGAYAVQGMGGLLISSIQGEYNNLLGLPVVAFVDALAELGYELI